jgi:hypothetical protein
MTGWPKIRARIESGDASQNEAMAVLANNVTVQNLTFRDFQITFGQTILLEPPTIVTGGTVRNCEFTQVSTLSFDHMIGGLAENCTFTVANVVQGAVIDVNGGERHGYTRKSHYPAWQPWDGGWYQRRPQDDQRLNRG